VRGFRRWLWSDVPAGSTIDRPACARHALAAFLRERYRDSIDDLMGLVQCDDPARGFSAGRRWPGLDRAIGETKRTIMGRIARKTGW
jgi:hypothetical protein